MDLVSYLVLVVYLGNAYILSINIRDPSMTQLALDIDGLHKTYPQWRKKGVVALTDINFSVKKGEIVGLLGPNGAGKTTAIKCICGLILPDEGTISYFGEATVDGVANHVSAVLEGNRNIYWRLTSRENLEFFAGLQGIPRGEVKETIYDILKTFDLMEKEDVPARMLSRGMQQKLALGCALIRDTPILLLDEPTLGLDVETSLDLRHYIRGMVKQGKTIVLSSHDMNVVEDICDRVVIIDHGRVVADDRVEDLKAVFKVQAYEIGLHGCWECLKDELSDGFKVEIKDSKTMISCQLKDSMSFYRLMDFLKERDIEIENISTKEPNFEEIFIKLLGRGQ